MIVADTSFVYALLDARDRRHGEAAAWYRQADPELATTPLAIAEIDHLAAARAGAAALEGFRQDLASGAYGVEWWASAPSDLVEIAESYRDLGLSLTDASLVVLAARLGTSEIATFDERHFRTVRPLAGAASFILMPMDGLG